MAVDSVGDRSDLSFYDQVVRVSRLYLGNSANGFIDRQLESHLHKTPQQMQCSDLDKLIDWIRVTVCYLTEDGALVEEYTTELRKLAARTNNRAHA